MKQYRMVSRRGTAGSQAQAGTTEVHARPLVEFGAEHHRAFTGIGLRQRFLRDEQGGTNRCALAEENVSYQTSAASMAPTTA